MIPDRTVHTRLLLTMYTVMHFLVDLSCIFYLMGMVYVQLPGPDLRNSAAVTYNAFAFALPVLLGLAADLVGKNALVSCLGCTLIVINYLVVPSPWVSIALIGIGNGLFHIGGGRQVIMDSARTQDASRHISRSAHYAPAGIFISSGALGVYLGRFLAGNFRQIVYLLMWLLLAVCVLVLVYVEIRQFREEKRSILSRQKISAGMLLLSLLIFVVVIIRSYYGFLAVYSWNHGFAMGLIFTLCIVAGKCTGGIVADRLGVKLASIISLAGAGILALFAQNSPVCGCLSILLFNMTMPITLTLLADLWKELPGFAFGALMLALFLGTLPSMVWHVSWLGSPIGQMGLCLVSLVLLLAVSGRQTQGERMNAGG